jgi:hypothetical protein
MTAFQLFQYFGKIRCTMITVESRIPNAREFVELRSKPSLDQQNPAQPIARAESQMRPLLLSRGMRYQIRAHYL